MKKIVSAALILGLVLFLIPMGFRQERAGQEPETPEVLTLPDSGKVLTILVDGQTQEMDLNQYLWGVVVFIKNIHLPIYYYQRQAADVDIFSREKAGKSYAVRRTSSKIALRHREDFPDF